MKKGFLSTDLVGECFCTLKVHCTEKKKVSGTQD